MRGFIVTAAAALALLGIGAGSVQAAVPHYNHVFIVVLENEIGDVTFGPNSRIPYLSQTLRSQGAYIPKYYATGHLSLDNYISMVSGQGPNPQTQADCVFYTDFLPGTPAADGQVNGTGCVYPASVKTIADQLEGAGLTWKGYMEDMGVPCRHPTINTIDNTQTATAASQYAARHNPFMYFHSIIDRPTCAANDIDLQALPGDLASATTAPSYAFITPDLCNDGHDEPCVDGGPGGMVQANTFLREWVPLITKSPAYKDGGLVIITFDEAETHDSSACCNERPGPNTPSPGGPTPGPGGGKIGAVLVSACITPGTESSQAYNHYSLLRSVEDNFGLAHLGFAGQAGLQPFGDDVLSNAGCKPACPPAAHKKKKKGSHKHKKKTRSHKHKKKKTGSHKHKKKKKKGCKRKRGKRNHKHKHSKHKHKHGKRRVEV